MEAIVSPYERMLEKPGHFYSERHCFIRYPPALSCQCRMTIGLQTDEIEEFMKGVTLLLYFKPIPHLPGAVFFLPSSGSKDEK